MAPAEIKQGAEGQGGGRGDERVLKAEERFGRMGLFEADDSIACRRVDKERSRGGDQVRCGEQEEVGQEEQVDHFLSDHNQLLYSVTHK